MYIEFIHLSMFTRSMCKDLAQRTEQEWERERERERKRKRGHTLGADIKQPLPKI